ncbi:hypothetical protein DFH06DRAFT_1154581 [Mycena polygramma]|nr:hypothetical protein DFH06DRAFT_1154581 [Mycena polygramma]
MGGHNQKKRRMARKASYEKEGKRMSARHARTTAKANEFFLMSEMLGDELLHHCDVETIMAVAKTGQYARAVVKNWAAANLNHLVEDFVGDDDMDDFFEFLNTSGSAMTGSVVTAVLTAPYRHNAPDFVLEDPRTGVLMPRRWTVTNLDIVLPNGTMSEARSFLDGINLVPGIVQPGLDRMFAHTTVDYVVYEARTPGYTISLIESRDQSVLTPVIGSTSTSNTNFATSANIYSLYPALLNERRTLESWFPTPVPKATNMGRRRIRSSFSTSSWAGPCGWSCPVLWRQVRGLAGVGVFQWGGRGNIYPDNANVGIPYTQNDLKWRLGDTCTNKNCPWYGGNYFTSLNDVDQV